MDFLSLVQDYGTGAVVVILISLLITEIRNSRKFLSSMEGRMDRQDLELEKHAQQVSWLRDNYTSREESYSQVEGWRRELDDIRDQVNRLDGRLYEISQTGERR